MKKKKFFYILPCFNEELNLKKLLTDFYNFYKSKKFNINIVIIDDGSNDNSLKLIKKLKKKLDKKNFKIIIISHKKNLGLGESLKDGFKYCFLKGKNNDVIISMDCDNSHTVQLSFRMLMNILKNKKDIVIASRYKKNSKTKGLDNLRIFLSYGAAILYKIFFPIKNVKDYTCGFRAFRLNVIKKAFIENRNFFSEKGFSASADILLKLFRYKNLITFDEVPINLRYDLKKGESKMKIIKTIFLSLRLIVIRKLFN